MLPHASNRQAQGAQPQGDAAGGPPREAPLPGRRAGYLAISIYAFGAFLLALVWIVVAVKIVTERELEASRLAAETANLASAFAEHTLTSLRTVDQLLLFVKAAYEERGRDFDLADLARKGTIVVPDMYHIVAIANEHGDLVQTSSPAKPANVARSESFRFHAAADTGQVFIGKPAPGHATGKWSLAVSRRVNKPDGGFGGVVSVAVDPNYFSRFYQRIDIGRLGMVALVGRDGVVRARQSGEDAAVGQDVSDGPLMQELGRSPDGTYRAGGVVDGVYRIFSYRALTGYPLVVVVGLAEADGLAQFEDRKRAYLWGAALLSIVLLALLAIQRRIAGTLAERERRYRTIIDTMSEGVVLRAADRRVLLASPAADRILGARPEGMGYEALRQRGVRAVREDGSPFPESEFPPEITLRTGAAVRHVVMGIKRPDDSLRWVSVSSAPVREAGTASPSAVVVSYDDITERRHTEEALRASEERLWATLHNTPGVAVQWFDREGRVQFWNSASERLYGIAAAAAEGRTFMELGVLAPEQTAPFLDTLARIERTGIAHGPDELTLRAANGSEVTVIYTMYQIPGVGGAPTFVCMDVDITERKRVAEALQYRHRLDELIFRISTRFLLARGDQTGAVRETLGDVGRFVAADRCYVSLLDDSGDTYSLASEWCAEGIASKRAVRQRLPTASLWKGIERDEIAYVTLSELPPEADAVRRVLEIAGIQSSLRVSIRLDGKLFGVLGLDSVRAEKRWPDDVAVLLRVVADILGSTLARERAQAEIRRLNAELGERVRERTVQLEAINRELEAFSYSVSHDLRGPLRRIEGFSRILLMSHADGLDEQGQGLLSRVRNSIQHMGRLIDDLLKLARVNQQAIVRGEIDLSAMSREVVASLVAGEPERAVECIVADGLAVNADRGLMRVALENLIGNAWKFTGNEPRARIEVGAGQVNGETVYHVRDNGAGFDMAYAANLFGAFQRLHSPEEFDGSGIGLATVRRIITRHSGRIWAESAPGRGSAFYFTVGAGD
jgi:PAS domain S-box-containing protein